MFTHKTLVRLQLVFKTIAGIFFILFMLFSIMLATEAYISSKPYHPDMSFNIEGEGVHVVGSLYFCIKGAERIDMHDLQEVVNEIGSKNNDGFKKISEEGDNSLSMRKENPNASPSPLIVRINISNTNDKEAYYLPYTQLQLKLKNGQLIKPSEAWQAKLGEAYVFSGSGLNVIPPDYVVKMMLVYPVPSDEETYKDAEIRFFYNSDDEFWAKKIDIPITYKEGTPTGDGDAIKEKAYITGRIAFCSFVVLFLGYIYTTYKAKKEEDEEE